MHNPLLDTMVLDTAMRFAAPASECAAAPIVDESSPDIDAQRVPLEPAIPLERAKTQVVGRTGQGEVILFTGGGENDSRLSDAALAFLLTQAGERSRSLLVDVPRESEAKQVPGKPIQVAGARLWRVNGPCGGGLRAWLLFLHQCRTDYTTTMVALPEGSEAMRNRLAPLADRTLVVASAVANAHRVLCDMRRAGAARCECLWLDTA